MSGRKQICEGAIALGLALVSICGAAQTPVQVWLTTANRSALLSEQTEPLRFNAILGGAAQEPVIEVDGTRRFQTMDGFGFALTGGSAQLLMRMDAAHRHALLEELAGTKRNGIAVSYLRVSIGASDMNERVFTYDDIPAGEIDPELKHFSLASDDADVVPVLKEMLAINPAIRILGTPWTAPSWMKTNGLPKAGQLKPELYDAYARYLLRYVRAMAQRGIRIDALTVQNEPLNPQNTPSMSMSAAEEAAFIGGALGPLLRRSGLKTKIVLYDHNCDEPQYPLAILADAKASQYVDGSGFHLYAGPITAMTVVHEAHPEKNLYFTEQMVIDEKADPLLRLAKPVAELIVGAPRNWSRNVLLWNLAADPQNGPHTNDGGCPVCEGAITLEGDTVTRNVAYYTVAHASRFVPPGSVRVQSSEPVGAGLANVAFRTPKGSTVLIVANTGGAVSHFRVRMGEQSFDTMLEAGSVATYVW